MEFNELILKRRAYRKYVDKKVPLDTIKEIISDSIQAPSWKNGENTRYYLAYSKEEISKVIDALPDFNKTNSQNCVYLISTFVKDKSGFNIKEGVSLDSLGNSWGAYDNGLHDAYLVLSAKNHGVDSLIMGIRDEEKLRSSFSIPEEEIIMSVIALGYGEGNTALIKRKTLDDILKIK
jgi:nitroreductase